MRCMRWAVGSVYIHPRYYTASKFCFVSYFTWCQVLVVYCNTAMCRSKCTVPCLSVTNVLACVGRLTFLVRVCLWFPALGSDRGSSIWLTALPIHNSLTLSNSAFCNAFQFRLGLSPRPMHAPRVRCGCGALVDPPPGSPTNQNKKKKLVLLVPTDG